MNIPKTPELLNPALNALKSMGGSASLKDIEKQVIGNMEYPPEIADAPFEETSFSPQDV